MDKDAAGKAEATAILAEASALPDIRTLIVR
jgi:hypothetical protein